MPVIHSIEQFYCYLDVIYNMLIPNALFYIATDNNSILRAFVIDPVSTPICQHCHRVKYIVLWHSDPFCYQGERRLI